MFILFAEINIIIDLILLCLLRALCFYAFPFHKTFMHREPECSDALELCRKVICSPQAWNTPTSASRWRHIQTLPEQN